METIKKENNLFYVGDNAEHTLAEITFFPTGADKIIIDHTYVSEGQKLVKKVVEYARQENKKIIPLCPFAKGIMTKSNEYKDVLL